MAMRGVTQKLGITSRWAARCYRLPMVAVPCLLCISNSKLGRRGWRRHQPNVDEGLELHCWIPEYKLICTVLTHSNRTINSLGPRLVPLAELNPNGWYSLRRLDLVFGLRQLVRQQPSMGLVPQN